MNEPCRFLSGEEGWLIGKEGRNLMGKGGRWVSIRFAWGKTGGGEEFSFFQCGGADIERE